MKPDLPKISAPAQRALQGIGVGTLSQLAKHKEEELLKLHGFGPASLPILRKALAAKGLAFRK